MVKDYSTLSAVRNLVHITESNRIITSILYTIDSIADLYNEAKDKEQAPDSCIKYIIQEFIDFLPDVYKDMQINDNLNGSCQSQVSRQQPIIQFVSILSWRFVSGRLRMFDGEVKKITVAERRKIKETLEIWYIVLFYILHNIKDSAFKTALKLVDTKSNEYTKAMELYKQIIGADKIEMMYEFLEKKLNELYNDFTFIDKTDSDYLIFEALKDIKNRPDCYFPTNNITE